jgi:nucleoside 2-deoxyribosyltransferase
MAVNAIHLPALQIDTPLIFRAASHGQLSSREGKSLKRRVFLAASFGLNMERRMYLFDVVDEAIQKVSASLNLDLEVVRPEHLMHLKLRAPGSIREAIRQAIRQADLMIADLSDARPNVLWEIGFAQALGKPVLLLANDVSHVPFDLYDNQLMVYQTSVPRSNLVVRLSESISDGLRSMNKKTNIGRSKKNVRRRRKVFFSYSHADEVFLHRILVHLRPLERRGLIDLWSDLKIKAGDRWREEIRRALADARFAVLLISADFLASEFITNNELPPLLVAAEKQGTRIIPVVVKPSRFLRDEHLSRFQALNDPKQCVIQMTEAEREELFARLAENIELELGELKTPRGPGADI